MPSAKSRVEINFCRLLTKCESMVSEKQSGDWRLEKYVKALEEKLTELKKINTCQPSKDALKDYSRQVEFLKGVVEAEKLPTASEKVMANQLLSPGSPSSTCSREIHLQTKSRYVQEMRDELLGSKDDSVQSSNGVRLRQSSSAIPTEDFDVVLRYHHSMQEKVAEEMMALVQNMKQNSLLAGHIIRKDTESLEQASTVADQNYSQLKVESDRLEVHAKRSCNWCVFLMLGSVCVIFLWMIVFMRMFPKR